MENRILVCSISSSKANLEINVNLFYSLFKDIVEVKNIRIFNKEKFNQAFIQVKSKEAGELAINRLHKKRLNIGRIKVYFSHKKNITFETNLEEALNQRKNNCNIINQSVKINKDTKDFFKDDQSSFGNEIDRTLIRRIGGPKKKKEMPAFKAKTKNLKRAYMTYKDLNKKIDQPIIKMLAEEKELVIDSTSDSRREEFSFLEVKPINIQKVNCMLLINIFGCFGNILEVAIDTRKNIAILRFDNEAHVINNETALDGIQLFGKTIRTRKLSETKIFDKESFIFNQNLQYRENKEKYFRFKKGLLVKAGVLSKTVTVSNLATEINAVRLYELLCLVHEPVKIIKVGRKNGVAKGYVVEFESIDQAVEVIGVLHNKRIEGKLIKLSFNLNK